MQEKTQQAVAQLIKDYHLQAHVEGGYFAEVYTADAGLGTVQGGRPLAGSIYFLLTAGDISHFHQIDCEEIWYYHQGCGLKIYLLAADGSLMVQKLGLNAQEGESPMVVIPRGIIFAAENLVADGYTFVSCVTTPKFSYKGFKLLPYRDLQQYNVEKRLCID